MAIIDIILLVIISLFTIFGLWFGLIHTLGSTIGFFAGIFLASRFFDFWGGGVTFKIIMFVLIYVVVGRLIGLLFYLIKRVLHIIPFSKWIDKLVGAGFGFIEGVLVVTGGIFIINYYNLDAWLKFTKDSDIVPYVLKVSKILMPFVTKALSAVQSVT